MHSTLKDRRSGVHTCSFLLILALSCHMESPLPHSQAVWFFFFFFLGHLLIFVDVLLQNTAHVIRLQRRSELPEGSRISTSSGIPRRHYSSLEDDQIVYVSVVSWFGTLGCFGFGDGGRFWLVGYHLVWVVV